MEKNSIQVALLGDVALHGLFNREPEKNKERFADVKEILQEADLVFANLEAPVWGGGHLNTKKKEKYGVLLYSDPRVIETVLPMLNIKAVSLANNHIYDCKRQGVENTIGCMEKMGIHFTGAGTGEKHLEPAIIHHNGTRIGFMAYVHPSSSPLADMNSEVMLNVFDMEKMLGEIEILKRQCDWIILSIHWGVDYSFYPTKEQRRIYRRFVDAGVNIIMGHHSHTVQPYERYNNGLIFYSLGSFCFGDFIYEGELRSLKRKTKKTILPFLELSPNPGAVQMKKCIPLKELQGNYVTRRTFGLKGFLARKRFMMKLKHKIKPIDLLIRVKESFIDRTIEYFFGYYRNPVRQVVSVIANVRKLRYGLRDYKERRKR